MIFDGLLRSDLLRKSPLRFIKHVYKNAYGQILELILLV